MLFYSAIAMRVVFGLPVLMSFFLIFLNLYLFHRGYLWESISSSKSMFSAFLVYSSLTMILWTFFRTVLTDPGSIPFQFDLIQDSQKELLSSSEYGLERLHAASSFCKRCNRDRPARTHHCSLCNKCIMRMDHHCPWIGNCIGINNYKYFTQFVVYCFIYTSVITGCCLELILDRLEECTSWTYAGLLVGSGLSAALGMLALYHLGMICINTNTIELRFYKHDNLFDFGWRTNFTQVFGDTWTALFFPVPSDYCDGMIYPVKLKNNLGEIVYFIDKILISD